MAAAARPSEVECRAVGVVAEAGLPTLLELLKGLSGTAGRPVRKHEMVLKSATPPATELRLQSFLADEPAAAEGRGLRWKVRHDAPITRGAIRELPVSVLAVTQGSCEGVDVPGFWQAMGMEKAHEGLRAGSIFSLVAADQKLEVAVVQLQKLADPGDVASAIDVSPGNRLVEVTCCVPGGSHLAGVEAIGKLGSMLQPFVELQKG